MNLSSTATPTTAEMRVSTQPPLDPSGTETIEDPTTRTATTNTHHVGALTDASTTGYAYGTRQLGYCKWFDKTKGFGFIQGLRDGHDYFAHHTELSRSASADDVRICTNDSFVGVANVPVIYDANAFRFLVAGEYVEFTIQRYVRPDTDSNVAEPLSALGSDEKSHKKKVLAVRVTGIHGGPLMFQTHAVQQVREQGHLAHGAHGFASSLPHSSGGFGSYGGYGGYGGYGAYGGYGGCGGKGRKGGKGAGWNAFGVEPRGMEPRGMEPAGVWGASKRPARRSYSDRLLVPAMLMHRARGPPAPSDASPAIAETANTAFADTDQCLADQTLAKC